MAGQESSSADNQSSILFQKPNIRTDVDIFLPPQLWQILPLAAVKINQFSISPKKMIIPKNLIIDDKINDLI